MIKRSGKLLIERFKDIGVLTLNRPERLNSINIQIIQDLIQQFKEWGELNSYPKVLLSRGAGSKAYCSGGDLKESYQKYQHTIQDPAQRRYTIAKRYISPYILSTAKTQHIAFLNGVTMGQGAGFSMMAPIKIATERTNFAMPQARIGLFNDAGSTYFLTHLVPPEIGLYLGLTATSLKGKELYDWGLATHFASTQAFDTVKQCLIQSQPSDNESAVKVISSMEGSLPEKEDLQAKFLIIKALFKLDSLQQIVERLKEANSRGSQIAKQSLEAMKDLNPLSLKIILQAYKRSQHLSYNECFEMECLIFYNLHLRGINNFIEGIRALLVDKDKKPKWNPKTIYQVNDSEVIALFEENKEMKFDLDFRNH